MLVPFNDPQVGPLTVTTKSDEFKKALAKYDYFHCLYLFCDVY